MEPSDVVTAAFAAAAPYDGEALADLAHLESLDRWYEGTTVVAKAFDDPTEGGSDFLRRHYPDAPSGFVEFMSEHNVRERLTATRALLREYAVETVEAFRRQTVVERLSGKLEALRPSLDDLVCDVVGTVMDLPDFAHVVYRFRFGGWKSDTLSPKVVSFFVRLAPYRRAENGWRVVLPSQGDLPLPGLSDISFAKPEASP